MLIDRVKQDRIDEIYACFVEMYHKEMSIFMKEISRTKKSKKAIWWTRRPYWDEELSQSWKVFHDTEKAYLQVTKRHRDYDNLKNDFLAKQRSFDKLLKKKKRSFQRSEVHNLEKGNTNDPVAF